MDCGIDGLTFTQPSLCKVQFAIDCDLSNIVKRFIKTGELPAMRNRPTIDDATNLPDDFFDAITPAVKVRQAFDQLPLEVRNKFNNDPLAWFEDGLNNRKEEDNEEKFAKVSTSEKEPSLSAKEEVLEEART